ncbi:MAG: PhzF family phenazine biosynthesis protein [Acetobacteraceae bacterium]
MPEYDFETVDVFTDRRFGGNPLAVLPDARGLETEAMQAIAREFNLSETTFVLPPADPAHTAQVRIFTPTTELAFAGHPNVGTALVLAARMPTRPDRFVFEEAAGLVPIRFDWSGAPQATLDAPRPLQCGAELPAALVAACVGLREDQIVVANHRPLVAGMGTDFVFAEVTAEGLQTACADTAAMRAAAQRVEVRPSGFPVHVYVRDGAVVRTRMFSPLSGIPEDPATGSANVTLAGLLLSLDGTEQARFTIHQGEAMGRPSLMHAGAMRDAAGIRGWIGGGAVAVLQGTMRV